MKQKTVAVVGAAETTNMGKIPNQSVLGLHADAALNAMKDAGLTARDIDGIATAGESPVEIAHYLGITPTYVDGTSVGGCSFMLHVRHAAAAINEGLCKTVLITHAESGRSRVGSRGFGRDPSSQMGQFEVPYGVTSPPTMFTIPVLRYMKEVGVTEEDLAMVAVIQREWAAKNPRASYRDPITVDDVLNSDMIAWPFRKLMCCLVTDGGGALILTSADRAKDFPRKPVYILGAGESAETPMISQMEDFTTSKAFRVSGKKAFDEAGIKHADVDHLMIYDVAGGAGGKRGLAHEPDTEAVTRQQQGQRSADDPGAANTDIKGLRHGAIVESRRGTIAAGRSGATPHRLPMSSTTPDVSARIARLFIYPIKSCGGVEVTQAVLTEAGLDLDRAWMVVDERGEFVSQRELPRMALVRPQLKHYEVVLRAPGMLALHLNIEGVEAPVRVRVWDDEVAALMATLPPSGSAIFSAPGCGWCGSTPTTCACPT